MIATVDLQRSGPGWTATLWLDPQLVSARADQQGLHDRSVAAAAGSERVRRALATAVATANIESPDGQQIVNHTISNGTR